MLKIVLPAMFISFGIFALVVKTGDTEFVEARPKKNSFHIHTVGYIWFILS